MRNTVDRAAIVPTGKVPKGHDMATLNETESLKLELAKLRNENANLKAKVIGKAGTMKVSEKGAASLYGMGRFPVTLYVDQWTRLLDATDDIRAFLLTNKDKLKSRAD